MSAPLRHAGLYAYLAVLLMAFTLYLPGLNSDFMLDDFPNLEPLSWLHADTAGLDEWRNVIASSQSGPLGRPLSMVSFGMQHAAWPDNPWQFKLVNLVLHCLTGLLAFFVTRQLVRLLYPKANHELFAFVAASFWLFLPIHVSTVLYVVQRMTILSGTFMLTGIYVYLVCRSSSTPRAPWYALGGLAFLGLMSVLSKETGVVLLPLIVMLEWILHSHSGTGRNWKRIVWTGLGIASTVFVISFLLMLNGFIDGYAKRDFSLVERLLTQSRILIDYVVAIAAPSAYQLSLFHDSYPIIKKLSSALPWILILTVFLVAAIIARRRIPLFSLGIFWYLAGHSLESTVVPLELYFEHRNYLPSFGIVLAVIGLSSYLFQRIPWKAAKPAAITIVTATFLLYVSVTATANVIWSDPVKQAILWTTANPDSLRARLEVTKVALRAQEYELAKALIEEGNRDFPHAPHFSLYAVTAHCETTRVPLPDQDELVRRIVTSGMYSGVIDNLEIPLQRFETGKRCKHLSQAWVASFLETWLSKEPNVGIQRKILILLGRTRYVQGQMKPALRALENAAAIGDNGSIYLTLAEWSASDNDLANAERYLERALVALESSGWAYNQRVSEIRKLIQQGRKKTAGKDQ